MTTDPTGPLAALRDRRAKALGRHGEALAAAHFERLGFRVLARNHRTRYGELDLVLADPEERTIVFCEVKTRRLGSGDVWDSLHAGKRQQVRRMAAAWLSEVDRPPVGGGAALRRGRRHRRRARPAGPPRPHRGRVLMGGVR